MTLKIKSGGFVLFLIVGLVCSFSCPAFAQQIDLSALMAKVDKLEKENGELRNELKDVKTQITTIQGANVEKKASAVVPAPAAASPVTSKFPISIYGFIKGDAIYNDDQVTSLGANAPQLGQKGKKNEMILSAKDTRLGLNINGPEILGGGKAVGKLEMDFWGNYPTTSDGSNSPIVRMRLAYVDLVYKTWDILAGQDWDFFAPFNPSTLNFDIMWRQGNLGDRHPQITGTKKFENILNGTITTKLGVLSTVTNQITTGLPVFSGYGAYESKWWDIPVYFGSGALFGRERASTTISGSRGIWGVTGVYKITPLKDITIMGEGYIGQNLASFRGGSPTNMVIYGDTSSSTRANGGWSQIAWRPYKKLELAGGLGIDNVLTDGNSTSTTVWDDNYSYFNNIKYDLSDSVTVGLEYQRFNTKYAQQAGGNANRVQGSLIYKF